MRINIINTTRVAIMMIFNKPDVVPIIRSAFVNLSNNEFVLINKNVLVIRVTSSGLVTYFAGPGLLTSYRVGFNKEFCDQPPLRLPQCSII